MKTPMILRKILFPLTGLFGLFVLTVLIINLSIFDEDINPEITQLMQPRIMPAENENAYFAIWGLAAASDKEMISAGVQIIDRYLTNRDKNGKDEISAEDYDEIFGGEGFDEEWLDTYPHCKFRTGTGCLLKMSKQLLATPIKNKRLTLMLNRYDEIIRMTQFQQINHTSFATPLPAYSAVLRLNQIKLAQLYNHSAFKLFVQHAEADMNFWKMVLAQGDTLLDKMIAVAGLWTDIQYLSELIQTRALTPQLQADIVKLFNPLTINELDISDAFITEASMLYRHLPVMTTVEINSAFGAISLPIHLLIQPNATNNKHYKDFLKPAIEFSKLTKSRFYQLSQSNQFNLSDSFKVDFSPSNLYNLVGKLLLNVSIWSATDYIARVHDLNGMISLVKLQLQLKQTTTDSIKNSIENANIRNPYTKKAMDYDEKTNELGFECLDKSSSCKVKL